MILRKNGNRYKIQEDFIDKLHNWGGTLLVIGGPSGVGKTTLSESLDLPIINSITTRKKRKTYETYDFISQKEFQSMESKNEFASVVKYGNNLYGFTTKEFEKLAAKHRTLVVVTCPTIYKMLKKRYKQTIGFFITTSREKVTERLLQRDGHLDDIRLASYELNHRLISHYDVVVHNNLPLWVMKWKMKWKLNRIESRKKIERSKNGFLKINLKQKIINL